MDQFRRWLPWAALALISATISIQIGTTFDEAIWITVGRKALDGQVLYTEAIDHKTPFILMLAGTLDLLPGPFAVSRGITIGLVVTVAGSLAMVTVKSLGLSAGRARAIGLIVGTAAAFQTVFTLTVELVAATVLLGALAAAAKGWYRLGGALGAMSALIDLRFAFLGIGLLTFGWETGDRRGFLRMASTALPIGLAGLIFITLHPDARFGILEMSLASRDNPWQLANQLAVAGRSLLFVAVAVWLVVMPNRSSLRAITWKSSPILILVPAVVLALLSRFPFDHYWLLTLPVIPVLAARIGSRKPNDERTSRSWAFLGFGVILVSLLPVLLHTVRSVQASQANETRVEGATEYLAATLEEGATFVKFGDRAFLASRLPVQYGAPSPVMHYYVLNTSRQDRARSELVTAIAGASVIVHEGELAVDEALVFEHVRPVHRIFTQSLVSFPCIRIRDGYSLHFRNEACPPD